MEGRPAVSQTAVMGATAEEVAPLDVAVVGPVGCAGPYELDTRYDVWRDARKQVFEAGAAFTSSQGAAVGLFLNGVRALGALEPTLPHRLIDEAVLFSHWRDYDDGGDGGKPTFRGKEEEEGKAGAGGQEGPRVQAALRLPECLDTALHPDGMRSVHRWMPGGPNRVLDVQAAPRGFVFYPISLPTAGPGGSRLVWSMYADMPRALAVAAGYGLPADVRSIAAATPPERVSEFGMYQHTPEMATPGAWARGRLVHVGDAAHAGPPDGTGANFALEDAAVLGACVRKHGLGPELD
eukprot:XP_001701907.1 predicted protein [Chlamydomonas reinhardtii]